MKRPKRTLDYRALCREWRTLTGGDPLPEADGGPEEEPRGGLFTTADVRRILKATRLPTLPGKAPFLRDGLNAAFQAHFNFLSWRLLNTQRRQASRDLREMKALAERLLALWTRHFPATRTATFFMPGIPADPPGFVVHLERLARMDPTAILAYNELQSESPTGGRPRQAWRDTLFRTLARLYRGTFGRPAGLSRDPISGDLGGPFVRFVAAVFLAVREKASHDLAELIDLPADPAGWVETHLKKNRRT